MTDLGWLDDVEARQRKHGGVTATDVARLVKALRDAQGHIAFKDEEIRGLRREVEEATRLAGYWRMKVARVEALAADMRTWCSPYGIATMYADRLDAALAGEDS